MGSRNSGGGRNMIYFAAGVYKKESWPNLSWVAKNFPGHKICILHVLQHSQLPAYSRYEKGIEKKTIQKNLEKYHLMLRDIGLEAEEVCIKMEEVEEGIVKLISQHDIKNLVMGAPPRDMVYSESKISKHVSEKGSALCQIWFLHKGSLIKTRHEQVITGGSSRRMIYEESIRQKDENEHVDDLSKVQTAKNMQSEKLQPAKETETVDAKTVIATDIKIAPAPTLSPAGQNVDDKLYVQLREVMEEANNAKREAFEESLKRKKAEKDVVEASQRAEATEKMYKDEIRLRRENEDAIMKHKQKLAKMSSDLVELIEELNNTLKKKTLLEGEIVESKSNIEELREKIVSSVNMLLSYKNDQDELKVTRDHALRVAESLRQQVENAKLNSSLPQFLSEFSYSEIGKATCYFHSSLKIDDRGVYKGILHHTEVSIKMMHGDSLRGPSEYRLEVDSLSKLRHPNIVTMIGICPEALAIIYEYSPNGSLEDRLSCKDNSAPLPWQTRIHIAYELCSVLIFLHSSKPQGFVHGALKPSNILLDANFTTKLGHFGNCRPVTTAVDSNLKSYVNGLGNVLMKMIMERTANDESIRSHSITNIALCPYMDPEFVITGETSTQHDVYAFGKILLRLLTGKEAWGITSKVDLALNDGSLSTLLDSTAGDWPYLQAQQLAHIAVRCTDMCKENRPCLKSEVLEVLRKTKDFSSKAYSIASGKYPATKPPSYCICPISQEVMKDPQVAADGFTYESKAIQGWINSGHDTSPMTGLTLAHTNFVPNHALRSTIQEWLHHH